MTLMTGEAVTSAIGQSSATKMVNLALQGGGTHGAFTWGVLDRLLEEERLVIWNRSSSHYRRALGASKGERLWRTQVGEAVRSRRWC
jgi:hypothetical protein